MKFILTILAFALSAYSWQFQPKITFQDNEPAVDGIDQVLRITVSSKEHLRFMENIVTKYPVDIWADLKSINGGKSYFTDIRVVSGIRAAFEQDLKSQQIEYRVMVEDVQMLAEESISTLADESYSADNLLKPVEEDPFFQKYQKMDSILSFLDVVVKEYSDVVEKVVVGKTYEGRDIVGLRFNNSPGKRNKIIYHGGQHAREWIGVATMCYFIRKIVTGYANNDETAMSLIEKFDLTIIPVMNVDGYIFTTIKNRMWRKNRQPNGIFCVGTDPNRNWDSDFGGPGASDNPCSEAYHGPSAFSAPETKAMSDYILKLNQEGGVVSYIDFHAYSQLWMHPYGSSCTKKPADLKKISEAGNSAADALKKLFGTKFAVGSVCNIIYQASGGSLDWANDHGVTYSYGVELRDTGRYGFLLPPSQIIPSGEETYAGILAMNSYIAEN